VSDTIPSHNHPNAERLHRALSHLVACIEESPAGSPTSDLPLALAREALETWRGYRAGSQFVAALPIKTVEYVFGRCPTCERTTVLEVS
jgi:hypothetical protein